MKTKTRLAFTMAFQMLSAPQPTPTDTPRLTSELLAAFGGASSSSRVENAIPQLTDQDAQRVNEREAIDKAIELQKDCRTIPEDEFKKEHKDLYYQLNRHYYDLYRHGPIEGEKVFNLQEDEVTYKVVLIINDHDDQIKEVGLIPVSPSNIRYHFVTPIQWEAMKISDTNSPAFETPLLTKSFAIIDEDQWKQCFPHGAIIRATRTERFTANTLAEALRNLKAHRVVIRDFLSKNELHGQKVGEALFIRPLS